MAGVCVYVYTYNIYFVYIHNAIFAYAAGELRQREVQQLAQR